MTRVWKPLALITQIQKYISHLQNPINRGSKPIGYYKREEESFVDTTCQLGGLFAYGAALMEPILADGRTTLLAYIAIDAAAQSPYDILYYNPSSSLFEKDFRLLSVRRWSNNTAVV